MPSRNLRLPTPTTVALVVVCLLLLLRQSLHQPSSLTSIETTTVTVQRVIDGDTVKLTDGSRVRLLGIDTPELAYQDSSAEAGAVEALVWLQQHIEGKTVTLRYGEERHDRYGRTLAWIYDPDGSLVNLKLLLEGHARLVTRFGIPEDLRTDLHQATARARAAHRGIWKKRN